MNNGLAYLLDYGNEKCTVDREVMVDELVKFAKQMPQGLVVSARQKSDEFLNTVCQSVNIEAKNVITKSGLGSN